MNRIIFIFLGLIAINFNAGAQCAGAVGCPTLQMSGSGVSCYGSSNGTASVFVPNISASYLTYTWSTGELNTTSISGKPAGTYSVTVKNICTGCTATGYFTVNTPDPIAISGTVGNVNCFAGNNGNIAISVIGGTAPYNVSWSNGMTGNSITGLTAGNYTVTVTDNKSCVKTMSFAVSQPTSALGMTFTKENVDCFGNASGSINISPYGGTPPYAFTWLTPSVQNTEDVQGLVAGSYPVTIIDNKNCSYNSTISITQPQLLTAGIQSTSVSCFGGSNGSVQVLPSGGVTPYSYLWTNSTYTFSQNTAILNNVPSEVYNVQITDANGCITNQSASVNTPTQLSVANQTITNVKCYGQSTGSISIAVIGGTVTNGYTYQWSNTNGVIPGATSNLIQNIPAGTYNVLITDNNGCTLVKTYQVTQPQSPLGIITNDVVNVLCYGFNTGSINISAFGGTPSYSYLWVNSFSTTLGLNEDLNNIVAGNYTLVVTDANNCTSSQTYTVSQPADTIEVGNIISPVLCNGDATGSINLITTGGTTPYTYEWNNSTYQLSVSTEDLINFPSDTYDLLLTDAHGCIYTESYYLPEPDLLTGNLVGVNILCKNENTGSIDLTVQGGVTPYQYLWSNGFSVQDPSNLAAGTYSVLVTDANFCEFTAEITLTEPLDTLGFSYEKLNVTCHGESNGSITLSALGGTPNYSIDWNTGETSFNLNDLTAGWYTFNLIDNNNCQVMDSIEIEQPELLLANFVVTPVTCNGFGDGQIDITPTGGTAPYTYTWFNTDFTLSSQNEDLIDFPADTYQIELRDSLNCFTEVFIPLPEPSPIVITSSTQNVTCAGGLDGSIDITVSGGNPGYTYNWTNGYTTEDLVNVPVDEYTVIVTDTKNCIDSMTIIIYEPEPITIDFYVTEVSCSDQFDGTINAIPSGGTGSFTYLWQDGNQNSFIDNLLGGNYDVVVTDIVGCQMTGTAFVPTNTQACIQPPNAFTPNGDNYNDTWHLENIEIYPEAEIKVFNRWGELIYEHRNPVEEWNGIHSGVELPSETYYYIITLDSQKEPLTGPITIVR